MNTLQQARPFRKTDVQLSGMKTDILIPFNGQYKKIYELLKSIWLGTKSNPYQIYLIDDCSPNNVYVDGFKDAPHTTIVKNKQQLGFGGALEAGFKAATEPSPFVVFMHSDCSIQDPNWLLELLKSYIYLRNQNVGLVSARTNNPGEGANPLLKSSQSDKNQDVILEKGCVPLYCAICERNLFDTIKGFIKPYPYAFYEDEELANRMRHFGLKQGISGKSWIYHEGGATISNLFKSKPHLQQIVYENRNRCIEDLKLM